MKPNPIRVALSAAWKDMQVIFRDRGLLAIIIGLPLVMSVLNSYVNQQMGASSEGVTFPVILVDQDDGRYGKQIETILESIEVLDITALEFVRGGGKPGARQQGAGGDHPAAQPDRGCG